MKAKCQLLFLSLLFAGIIVCSVGFYFSFIKAGLPYQDPTTEMTIQWLANERAGKLCMITGLVVAVIGAVGRIVILISNKRIDKIVVQFRLTGS